MTEANKKRNKKGVNINRILLNINHFSDKKYIIKEKG